MDKQSQEKINRLQDSLSTLRKVAGWSAEDLGELLDVTRQTIVNLETGQTKMTKVQYMAIRLALESEVQSNNNDTLAKLIILLVDDDDLEENHRSKLKETVDTATGNVGRRAGASAASKAAIAALIPILASSIFTVALSPFGAVAGAIAAGTGVSRIFDILKGGSGK